MTDERNTHAPMTAPPRLEIDWALYASMLEDMEASEEEKRELIAILWNIVVAFVDLGFGISATQQACGETGLDRLDPAAALLEWDREEPHGRPE